MRLKIPIKIGDKFNRLTVVSELEGFKFLCRCICGNTTVVYKGNLLRGTKSCGCLSQELSIPYGLKSKYPELFSKYKSARQRCNNPKSMGYKNYGARGIKFLFNKGFVDFANYCLEIGWKPGLQMDRINNHGNYERGNLRFVTVEKNQRNTRRNKYFLMFGEAKTLPDWSEDPRCVVSRALLWSRILHGWDPEKAMTVPLHQHVKFN